MGSKAISVAVTPNGYADAVCGERFMMPEERRMTFSSVLDIIEGKVRCNTNTAAVFVQVALSGVLTSVCCCCCLLFQTQSRSAVFYVQKQCSNLLEELPELTDDVEPHISWMSTALGDLMILSALRPIVLHVTLLCLLCFCLIYKTICSVFHFKFPSVSIEKLKNRQFYLLCGRI